MTDQIAPRPHGPLGRRIATIAAAVLFAAVALKWGWMRIAEDLFALPEASFAQVLAATLALVSVLVLARVVLRPTAAAPAR